MKKFYTLFAFLGLIAACYTDDSSIPNPNRLPFEDFTEFFAANNAVVDTFEFTGGESTTLTTPNGIKVMIPGETVSETGAISLEYREANSKSDFLLLNQPTLDGSTILETSEAISIRAFQGSNVVNFDNPITIEAGLISNTTAEMMELYYNENGWNADATDQVEILNDGIRFQTTRAAWQMGAKPLDANTVNLSITTKSYSGIPHDVRAFAVLANRNVILPLTHNADLVSANGMLPKDEPINIVFIAMDHFKLHLGMETITLSQDESMELRLDLVTPDEMVTMIKNLN